MHIHGIGGVMGSTTHPNLTIADTGRRSRPI